MQPCNRMAPKYSKNEPLNGIEWKKVTTAVIVVFFASVVVEQRVLYLLELNLFCEVKN